MEGGVSMIGAEEYGDRPLPLSEKHCASILLKIADIGFQTVSVDPLLHLHLPGAAQKFHNLKGGADLFLEAAWGDISLREERGKIIFDSGALWKLYENTDHYVFYFCSRPMGSIAYKMAEIDKNGTRGKVFLHRPYFDPGQPIDPLEYPLDELLLIHLLGMGKGVEVHACGVVDSLGQGHLFLGQSGAGKTTLARLWEKKPGVTILNDDRIVLRKADEKFWMFGTPWHGEGRMSSPCRAPLRRIYFLRRGEKNEFIPQRVPASIGGLFACSFLPFYNPQAVEFSLAFYEEVVKKVQCGELRVFPDERVIDFITGLKTEERAMTPFPRYSLQRPLLDLETGEVSPGAVAR
jgi:hypothetical protein